MAQGKYLNILVVADDSISEFWSEEQHYDASLMGDAIHEITLFVPCVEQTADVVVHEVSVALQDFASRENPLCIKAAIVDIASSLVTWHVVNKLEMYGVKCYACVYDRLGSFVGFSPFNTTKEK